MFVWCTVVYAHGRTYIDVSFSCLYGVPLVYARGRTHMDRAFTWCTIYFLHSVSSSLYGVPLCTWCHLCSPHSFCVVLFVWCTVVYAHGRTYIDVSFSCLYGVPLVYARGRTRIDRALAWLCSNHLCFPHSLCVVLDVSLFVFVWCTVSVRTRSYLHWRGFMWLYGVPYVCLVYRLRSVMVVLASMALHHVCMLYR